ncbi:MAG: DNA polymerase III subunit gamma/tau [Ruminiclostridium sp.]|nr:DNA polymerase III subunit gamma/tau [Ruminiclostridium sp.]
MYQALYRKWRPRTFEDVVGQTHITETLRRQVATGRLSHAYLFTGTRGTGKTTCAKILAQAVNCENPVDGSPCNCCPACQGILSGGVLDVVELDAASNNGVDQIRALRDEAIYTPAAVRKRVYIVDEVHMLSTPAFNALLKILEEPPPHLMFILATTELHKVPATIKSRCQQFAFKRITPRAIAEYLGHVAQTEGIALKTEAANLLARLADGGLRDGLSLLDQCSGSEGDITEDVVLDILGLAGNRRTTAILDCVARDDTVGALKELDDLYRDGKDMGAFLGELSTLVRDLLIRKTAPEGGQGLLTGGYEEKAVRRLTESLSGGELVQMMTLLQTAQADLYRSSNRRLDAELCLIRLCDRRLAEDSKGLAARITRLEEQLASSVMYQPVPGQSAPVESVPEGPTVKEPATADNLPPWEEQVPSSPEEDLPPWDIDSASAEPAAPPVCEPVRAVSDSNSTPQQAPQEDTSPIIEKTAGGEWEAFLKSVQNVPPPVQSFLRQPGAVTGVFEETQLTLWVDSELTKDVFSKPVVLSLFGQAAEAHTGRGLRVICKVGRPEPSKSGAASPEPTQEEDHFNDLLALGSQFSNFTVK